MQFIRSIETLKSLDTKIGDTYKRACAKTYYVYPELVQDKLKLSAKCYVNPDEWNRDFATNQAQEYMRHYEQAHEEPWFLYGEIKTAEKQDGLDLTQSDCFWLVSVNLKASLMAKEGLTEEEMKKDTKIAVSEGHVKEVVQIMLKRDLFWCFAPVAFCCPIGNNLVKMAPVNNRNSLRIFTTLLKYAASWYSLFLFLYTCFVYFT